LQSKKTAVIKKLDIYTLKSFIGPLLITTFIGDFILMMQFFWVYVDELVGKGLEWYIVAELMYYTAITLIPMALPIGVLLASLMLFGNLGERYEIVALKAAGISLQRTMRPLIIFIFILSGFAMYFSNNILPKANLKFQSLFYDIRKQKMAFNLTEGVYYDAIEGYVIKVNKKDKNDDRTLYGIIVYDHKNNKQINDNVTFAQKGTMDISPDGATLILTLYDGYNYDDSYENKKAGDLPFKKIEFKKEIMRFDLSQFDMTRSDEDLRKNHYKNYNYAQITKAIDSLALRREYAVNIFVKYADQRFMNLNIVDTSLISKDTTYCNITMPLLSNYDLSSQKKIISNALDHARSVKTALAYKRDNVKYMTNLTNQHKVEFFRRSALAFACLVLFFIGAPLGAIIRKGGLGLPLVLSTLIFILYYIILTSGQKAALKDEIPPFIGLWIANLIIMPVGIFLTAKATSDSPLFDKDSWEKIFYKVSKTIRKKRT
jgi:lipopolysaccharide export system permease protein